MNLTKTAFALAVAIAATGCTHRITDFTFLSTKNVDLSQAASFERGTTRATGEDQVYIIVFIPTGIPNIKEATDRAIESVPGAVGLVDGVVYRKWFVLPLLGGFDKFTVEGTPLINKKAIQAEYLTANAQQLEAVYNYQRVLLTATSRSTGIKLWLSAGWAGVAGRPS